MESFLKIQFEKAVELEKSNDYEKALKEYVSVLRQDRNCREAYMNLGSLYFRMNDTVRAMKCFKMSLHLGEDYLTYFNIGSIYYKTREFKKAVLNFEKSRKLNDHFLLSTLVSGLCFSRMNNIKAAETNFNDVLTSNPYNRVALTALAIMYYNRNNYEEAVELLNRLIMVDRNNAKIRELKFNSLYRMGKIDETVLEIKSLKKISDGYRYYDDFIESVPVEAYNDRYGTIDEKIELLREKGDSDRKSLISLSLCHLFKGETDAAIDYLFKAKKQMPA